MNNTQRRNTNVMVTPQPEGVQEFKVITSGFAAKYGRFAGGMVSVVTRSGGTRVRSPLCEFLRNNDFDARNFFDATKSKLILNQYGATVTGPVVLPKLDYVGVLSPTLVLNVRYGIVSGIFPEERVTCGADLGAPGFSSDLTRLPIPSTTTLPRAPIAGFATLSNFADGGGFAAANTHPLVGDRTKATGRHSIRFGANARLFRTFSDRYSGSVSPDFTFPNTCTKGPVDHSAFLRHPDRHHIRTPQLAVRPETKVLRTQ